MKDLRVNKKNVALLIGGVVLVGSLGFNMASCTANQANKTSVPTPTPSATPTPSVTPMPFIEEVDRMTIEELNAHFANLDDVRGDYLNATYALINLQELTKEELEMYVGENPDMQKLTEKYVNFYSIVRKHNIVCDVEDYIPVADLVLNERDKAIIAKFDDMCLELKKVDIQKDDSKEVEISAIDVIRTFCIEGNSIKVSNEVSYILEMSPGTGILCEVLTKQISEVIGNGKNLTAEQRKVLDQVEVVCRGERFWPEIINFDTSMCKTNGISK